MESAEHHCHRNEGKRGMTRKAIQSATIMEESILERTSRILGPSSASAQALAEVKRRRDAGEENIVAIEITTKDGTSIVVGPNPDAENI